MRKRIFGLVGGGRKRRVAIGGTASAVVLAVVLITNAFAVHDLKFQLDGDVISSTQTCVGDTDAAPGCQNHFQTLDWNSIFTAAGANQSPLPTGFDAARFSKDFNNNGSTFLTSDDTTFATGSKDTLAITPGWQCNHDANVNSKIDVMNGYATAYTDDRGTVATADDHDILYFGLERNTNSGDANVGFWFLQDDVSCSSTGGSEPFVGDHQDGDLLIVSAFTNGGTVSTIDVYRWNDDGPGGNVDGLGSTPVAHGKDCKTTAGADTACATVNGPTQGPNSNGTINTPWLTANKADGVANSLRTSEFFEGGLDLTAANLSGKCFNTFMADTRSSQSLTATLFDYALGQLGECSSTTVTTPKKDGTPPTNITSEPIPATGTLDVKDSALVTVNGGGTFTGEVKYYLCRSSELRLPDSPPGTPGALDPTGTCTHGGTQIGAAKAVTSSPSTVVSDKAALTAADRYCWRAEFSGDSSAGVPGSSDSSSSECFTVTPLQPTVGTTATGGPVDFGNSITDTVALGGTANRPGSDGVGPSGTIGNPTVTRGAGAGGKIHVTVFGPDSCTTVANAETTKDVSGDGNYGGAGAPWQFTPTKPGEYVFVASYDGDGPNTKNVAATACASQPAGEKVTVRQIPTDIKTKQSWYPNDTATISATSGNLAAGGKVLFELFDNATCDGSSKYSEEKTLTGGNATEEVGTNNTSYRIATGYADAADSLVGRHSWRVTYTPATLDTAHTGSRSTCDSEHFNITYTNDNGPGADLP